VIRMLATYNARHRGIHRSGDSVPPFGLNIASMQHISPNRGTGGSPVDTLKLPHWNLAGDPSHQRSEH